MDNLLVDLDKVLDDFEAEENSAPGTERKPSGFQEYLEQTNNQTLNDIENMETYKQYEKNMYDEGMSRDFSDKELSSVRYDFPYEPEKFDLSEADFAPSTNFGESSYNGSLDSSQNKKMNNEPVVNSLKQFTNYPGIQAHHMNGTIEDTSDSQNSHQSQYGLLQVTQSKEKNNALKLQMTQSEIVKAPIQADNSPGVEPSKMAFQMNGHSDEAHGLEHSEKPVYHQQLSSIPSLNSINSSPEYDKYPVQCNTPQTPKDPTVNPFEAQLSLSSGGSLSPSHTNSSQVQPKRDAETMQDIPKLQNLKEDLEMSCDSRGNTEQYWSQGHVTSAANSSQSLPATLHQTVFQNGANSTGSLPSELETEEQSTGKSKSANQSEMEIGTDQRDEMTENHPVDRANRNIYFENDKEFSTDDPDDPVNKSIGMENIAAGTNVLVKDNNAGQKTYMQNVVGFGNIDEVDDDTDLNAYLGDESEGVSNHGTDSHLSKFSSENQSGHGFSNFTAENQDSLRVCDTEIVNKEDKEQKLRTKVEESDMDTSEMGVSGDNTTSMSRNTFVEKTANLNDRDSGFSEAKFDTKTEPVLNQMKDSDMEIFKILPTNPDQSNTVVDTNPVITNLASNLSPVANISLDSGVASLNDNLEDISTHTSELNEGLTDAGARPKDSQNKVNRPNSLMGLSTVDLKSDSPFVMKPLVSPSVELKGETSQVNKPVNPVIERMVVDSVISQTEESRQLMENSNSGRDTGNITESNFDRMEGDNESNVVEMRYPDRFQPSEGIVTGRPRSWSPSDSGQPPVQKQKRPTSLNLPPPPTFNPACDREMSEEDQTPETDAGVGMETTTGENQDLNVAADQDGVAGAEGGAEAPYIPPEHMDLDPPPPYSSTLGTVAPKWIPDAEAPICMSCESRFTFTKRRHHCRACGKVFCSTCCSMKNRLPYLKNQEARVCVLCHSELAIAERNVGRPPHPNNPSDYCSVVPPTHAAGGATASQPPSVLVPVLKRDGSVGVECSNRQSAPKQVMFSDGIRPGGDLTELDGSSEVTRMPPRRSRVQKRVERVAQGQHSPRSRRLRTVAERTTKCLIPEDGLPPLSLPQSEAPGNVLLSNPDPNDFMPNIKDENKAPVIFAINTNLCVSVKIVTLDCCVNRTVWCFTTRGMTSVGQEEIVIVLESLPEENTPPKDVFVHLNNVFEDASKGNVITELGHSIFNQSFLGSRDHGGFLYIRASFQCVQKLTLPGPPFLFGILLQKWETPWAKVFPLRLLLRLGAEYRYYPCPLIGIRNRKPVFFEIGHTIMNLLADFRNYQYMLPNIRGVAIHMEDKVTKINFPRNRYEELMKVVNNSNEHVMAIAASFSAEADSHLVCIQNDDGNYQTQAINIQNKPRKVTGASFVVFNGALKSSSGLSAKSSIVEDGLMVQISPDSMLALKQAIRDMHDYPINCGLIGAPKPDETVVVQWVEDDKNINIGVKSPVDGMNMDGIESLRIHHATDYIGEKNIVRWTEIFFIQNEERGSPKWDPVDLSRIGETVATACCMALTQHLEKMKEAQLERIGLRVTLGSDNVGYEAGAKGERLPDVYMNDLDNELIPVIHRATQPDTNIVLELIFEVLE
ncbi:uncharacterized protein LOC128555782 isoform X2 [Mercenaria mercenaria]|uniref:uncharacterized protein LOC128555782 isoform X2 n=1 Tax=Mercenaria mercenaria TaxID=6596 RepID=UPI00234EC537|nr:uncharacterized protein LOC128555782 isoform X2 [Mercenaria mercenaria]